MRLALAFACMCVMALVPAMVAAVPIPYYNCATPAAHVRITTAEADVWSVPPPMHERSAAERMDTCVRACMRLHSNRIVTVLNSCTPML